MFHVLPRAALERGKFLVFEIKRNERNDYCSKEFYHFFSKKKLEKFNFTKSVDNA